MSKQRTVWSTDEVPHIWANKSAPEGRNAKKTIYFDGDTIYSYGRHFPIARHVPDKLRHIYGDVVITTAKHSVTTTRHVSSVRRAIGHLRVTELANIDGSLEPQAVFLQEMADYVERPLGLDTFPEIAPRLTSETAANRLAEYAKTINRLVAMLGPHINWSALPGTFEYALAQSSYETGVPVSGADIADGLGIRDRYDKQLQRIAKRRELTELDIPQVQVQRDPHLQRVMQENARQIADKIALENKRRAEEEARHEAELQRVRNELLPKWESTSEHVWQMAYLPEIYLRLNGDVVQTSKGATVPVGDAKALLELFRKVKVDGRDLRLLRKVGDYTVTSISPKRIVAGCHTIRAEEIERFASRVGW